MIVFVRRRRKSRSRYNSTLGQTRADRLWQRLFTPVKQSPLQENVNGKEKAIVVTVPLNFANATRANDRTYYVHLELGDFVAKTLGDNWLVRAFREHRKELRVCGR